ncbi:MAG: T9SS type A sorting domain-containing protein, partial [Bacteroidetes bacterium]|nr:T9SS type A sorting domain-containing protein [Bacteroidota bacterium]
NYPNPFNPVTTIPFTIPHRSHVTVRVFSLLGEHIATLVDDEIVAGEHTVTWMPEGLASGSYFYRLQARSVEGGETGNYIENRVMLLLR